MAQTNLYFDEEEEKIISKHKKLWKLSKHDTLKKIVREFERRNTNATKKIKKESS